MEAADTTAPAGPKLGLRGGENWPNDVCVAGFNQGESKYELDDPLERGLYTWYGVEGLVTVLGGLVIVLGRLATVLEGLVTVLEGPVTERVANRVGVPGWEPCPRRIVSCERCGIRILGGSSLASFKPPILLRELIDPSFLIALFSTGFNAGDGGAVGGGVDGVTSRRKRATIWLGRSWASTLYSSRSCSPVSPTSMNLDSGKLSSTSTTLPRLRSAADSPHKPCKRSDVNYKTSTERNTQTLEKTSPTIRFEFDRTLNTKVNVLFSNISTPRLTPGQAGNSEKIHQYR